MHIRQRTSRRGRIETLELRTYLAGGVDRLVNDNAGATPTSNFSQSEAVVLSFGNTVLTAFDDSGSNAGGATHFIGFSRSTNGGTSFTDAGVLPPFASGDAGEASLARDELTGRIYMTTLGFTVTTVQVWRSDTDGASWLTPVNGSPGGSSEDTPTIAVDNFAGAGRGNVYVVSRRFGTGPALYLYRSTDGGATFGSGVLLSGVSSSQGGRVVIAPDHSVSVVWYESGKIVTRRSTNLGVSFGATVNVATGLLTTINGDLGLTGVRAGTTTPGAFRTQSFPHVAINPVSGNIYVAFNKRDASTNGSDIFLTQSTDNGLSWSFPLRLNDDTGVTDQWNPTLAVTPDGSRIGVFYYSRQEDPTGNNLYRFYGRTGTITGAALFFNPGSPVSDVASFPEFGRDTALAVTYMGDRNVVSATNDGFHVIWSDSRSDLGAGPRKDPNVYYDKIPVGPNGIWTGLGDGINWTNANNWTNDTVPGPTDNVVINLAGSNPTVVVTGNQSALTLQSSEAISISGRLTIAAGSTGGAASLVKLTLLGFTGTGALDLGANDLIVSNVPKSTMENFIRTAYNFGAWNGPTGIFSSTAKNNPTGNTTLGLLGGQEFNDNNGGLFNNYAPLASDVLVKYTYFGDIDFNGQVDVGDYNIIDFGYVNHLTGWSWGDADWSAGATDVSDYNLIDFAFSTQTAVL